jgi:hypothetical protein
LVRRRFKASRREFANSFGCIYGHALMIVSEKWFACFHISDRLVAELISTLWPTEHPLRPRLRVVFLIRILNMEPVCKTVPIATRQASYLLHGRS